MLTTSDKYFPQILEACWDDDDPETKQKGIAAIQQLTKIDENRNILYRWGVLKLLVHIMKTENTESTYRHAVVSLFRLVSNKDRRKAQIVKLGVLEPLLKFLTQTPTHSNDLKYWSLLLVNQLSLTVEKDFIVLIAGMARLSFGNVNMQKLCLHSLVRLISNLESQEQSKQLAKLIDMNMVALLTSCLRNEDIELVSWAAHQAESHEEFLDVKGLEIMIELAPVSNIHISLIISDIMIFLCTSDKSKEYVKQADILPSAIIFLKSTEMDLQYAGALLLLNLSTLSDAIVDEIVEVDEENLEMIRKSLLGTTREDIQAVLAKTVVTIARKRPSASYRIIQEILYPLLQKVNSHFLEKSGHVGMIGSLYTIQIILQTYGILQQYTVLDKVLAALGKLCVNLESFLCGRLCQFAELPEELKDLLGVVSFPEDIEDPLHPEISRITVIVLELISSDEDLLPQSLASLAKIAGLALSHDRREVRNDSWTFESIRANYSVSRAGKYSFEVKLMSNEIIQVGWASADCRFDPEGGEGVGDDDKSYAYDGFRKRKWHSNFIRENTYGKEWITGDIVTALLDLDRREMSFLLNGEDLGVAFENVPQDVDWFPAVSLAAGQGCRFNFGNASGGLRYCPVEYGDIGAFSLSEFEAADQDSAEDLAQEQHQSTILSPNEEWKAAVGSDGSHKENVGRGVQNRQFIAIIRKLGVTGIK
ncbi:hypothetical protein HDU97_008117 [Phlyctochytrium planicorne]|nr:hypothetical protein HDU97_008117 [Phlyctochytrium planicorne]